MGQLHIVLIPAMAHGHMIPILDMAKLFTSRGLKATIITTPSFAHSIEKARESGIDIGLSTLQFPPENSSLPENILSLDQATTLDLLSSFIEAMSLIQDPVEKLLQELNPNCLVSDTFLPWTVDSAAKLGIPRLDFHGTSCFALCASEQMRIHKPYENASSDSEPFVLPGLPHELSFLRTQVPPHQSEDNPFAKMLEQIRAVEGRSYGVIINSFYELEPDYADYYKNVMGRKTYHVGPLFLRNERSGQRGKESCIDEHECLEWLDSKNPDSVVYVCFGSMTSFSRAQLQETAAGLEASGQDFIWVVGKRPKNTTEGESKDDWLPEGFEERVKGKGLIIRGWAPQLVILNHRSVGAFVTHCGWNSTLEGISAGVPMVTWPAFAEQFYNEKMVTDVLGTGLPVGNKKWMKDECEGVGREAVKAAVRGIMVGEAAEGMRVRAKRYKEMAREAVGDGGSSHGGLSGLIDDLSVYVPPKH